MASQTIYAFTLDAFMEGYACITEKSLATIEACILINHRIKKVELFKNKFNT